MTSFIAPLAGTCVALGLLTACSRGAPSIATAELRDNAGTVIGSAHFEPRGEDVKVVVEVSGLSPGAHGIHVHEVGKCEAPGFASAGAHFNPGGQPHHGSEGAHHAGDLPNLQVAADGTGRLEAVLRGITMRGRGHHSLFHVHGSSLLIHRDADDMVTSPSGNSGERIACGVIVEGGR